MFYIYILPFFHYRTQNIAHRIPRYWPKPDLLSCRGGGCFMLSSDNGESLYSHCCLVCSDDHATSRDDLRRKLHHFWCFYISRWLLIFGHGRDWFHSFVLDRFQRVDNGDPCLSLRNLTYSVPQGSMFFPMLFNIYVKPPGKAVKRFGL